MVARIGRLDPPRVGSFQVKPLEKTAGIRRIGCFGDSFTAGLEVSGGLDLPMQLERKLHDHGASHVEIVNFGNSGFGLHQMHMMAELVAPRFGIDLALYVPMLGYWWLRDGTFAQWQPPSPTLAIHARYVLDGDDVRLVDPIGTTETAQFHAYTRLVTPMRYLRYDRRPPSFLQAWFPSGRTLPNPFFYGSEGEVREGYRRLLRRQLAGPPSVVLDPMGGVADLMERPQDDRRRLLPITVPQRFPYLAPLNHWSPWGNRLVAEYALRAFDVGASSAIDVMETSVDPPAPEASNEGGLVPHDEARVLLADRVVGGVYRYEPGRWEAPRVSHLPVGTEALIALAAPGQPLVDAVFIPLDSPQVSNQLTAEVHGTETRVPLSMRLRWVAKGVARLDLCDGGGLSTLTATKVAGRCIVPSPWDTQHSGRAIKIRLGDDDLATVDAGLFGVVLRPAGPYYKLRADGDLPADPSSFPERGQIALVLSARGIPVAHVPLGRFRRTTDTPPAGFEPLPIPSRTNLPRQTG